MGRDKLINDAAKLITAGICSGGVIACFIYSPRWAVNAAMCNDRLMLHAELRGTALSVSLIAGPAYAAVPPLFVEAVSGRTTRSITIGTLINISADRAISCIPRQAATERLSRLHSAARLWRAAAVLYRARVRAPIDSRYARRVD